MHLVSSVLFAELFVSSLFLDTSLLLLSSYALSVSSGFLFFLGAMLSICHTHVFTYPSCTDMVRHPPLDIVMHAAILMWMSIHTSIQDKHRSHTDDDTGGERQERTHVSTSLYVSLYISRYLQSTG